MKKTQSFKKIKKITLGKVAQTIEFLDSFKHDRLESETAAFLVVLLPRSLFTEDYKLYFNFKLFYQRVAE